MGREKKKEKIILTIILILLVVINYGFIEGLLEKTFKDPEAVLVEVERVVDGDTVIINGSSMRLLGINSPEKGQIYYEEAKTFLEESVMNKTLIIKSKGTQLKFYG